MLLDANAIDDALGGHWLRLGAEARAKRTEAVRKALAGLAKDATPEERRAAVRTALADAKTFAFDEVKHPRAPDGRWTEIGGAVVAFHGTVESVLAQVKKEGLRAKRGSRRYGGKLYEGERGRSVFIANNKSIALEYANGAAFGAKGLPARTPVILTLRIPKSEFGKFKKDTAHLGPDSAFAPITIRPSWIAGAIKRLKTGGWRAVSDFVGDADYETLYVVLHVDDMDDENGLSGRTRPGAETAREALAALPEGATQADRRAAVRRALKDADAAGK